MDTVDRQPFYFGSQGESLLGWIHTSRERPRKELVAVICNPLGTEYMSGYRSFRHLADQLAAAGVPALRFDYARTGDSTGGDLTGASVEKFVENIEHASERATQMLGTNNIVLVGIGLGATFAALAAQRIQLCGLVLWNATVSGKRFVREQKLLSELLNKEHGTTDENIDSAGVYLTATLQQEFRDIDLTKLDWAFPEPVLVASRDDMAAENKLVRSLGEHGLDVTHQVLPGYKEMMDHPTDTVVPAQAIGSISDWVAALGGDTTGSETPLDLPDRETTLSRDEFVTGNLVERAGYFGADERLFGVATIPDEQLDSSTAYVFLNCGSEHHVGPHRMYTILARLTASRGHLCFRFDIEGIGDSISVGNNAENESYSPVATEDLEEALRHLTEEHGCNRFVLAGICAGAYHSFKGAAEITEFDIVEAVLINPLVFEWNYDNPDDHFRFEARSYKGAARDVSRWKKVLSGKADYSRLLRAVRSQIAEKLKSAGKGFSRVILRRTPPGLPSALKSVFTSNRKLTLILADDDPGFEIMKIQAGRETEYGVSNGYISVHYLPHANHGFSKKSMQNRLIDKFVELSGD